MKKGFTERAGDWYCSPCPNGLLDLLFFSLFFIFSFLKKDKFGKALNFASRSNCVKCGAPKGSKGAAHFNVVANNDNNNNNNNNLLPGV